MKQIFERIAFLALVCIIFIAPFLASAQVTGCIGVGGSTGGTSGGVSGGISGGIAVGNGCGGGIGSLGGFGLPGGSIYGIIGNTVFWLLGIFGFLGIIGFVVSGIMYLVAAGDDSMIKRAKAGMLYSIIGVIVGLLGLVIIQAVNAWLSGVSTAF